MWNNMDSEKYNTMIVWYYDFNVTQTLTAGEATPDVSMLEKPTLK